MPIFGPLMSGPNPGEVVLMIKTVASGTNDTRQLFHFSIAPMVDGIKGSETVFPIPDYQSGHYETVTMEGLEQGRSYVFFAVAANIYGRSEPSYSSSIILQGLKYNCY